jgi:tRNA G46 methylase TrmB
MKLPRCPALDQAEDEASEAMWMIPEDSVDAMVSLYVLFPTPWFKQC